MKKERKAKPKFTQAHLLQVRVGTIILVVATGVALWKNMWWVCFITAGICGLWALIIKNRYVP